MTDSIFNSYSRYYDLLYRDKDYAGEADYIEGLLRQHGINRGDLLEFGSGTGKHGRLLAARGYNVHGIERSADMVSKAKNIAGFTSQQGDICIVKLGRRFDAVLALFHVVSYQITNTQLEEVFSNAFTHLNSGGLFVFDFWYTPAVYAQQPTVRVKRMADDQIEITRIAEPIVNTLENRVDVKYSIFARNVKENTGELIREVHSMRHFSIPEIDLMAQLTGFKRIHTEEFQTRAHPSVDTWGVCVVLKKS